jgi:hypothetical protein
MLIEGMNTDGAGHYAAGFTPSYLPVRLRDAAADAVGRIVPVRVLRVSDDATALEARIAPGGPGVGHPAGRSAVRQ